MAVPGKKMEKHFSLLTIGSEEDIVLYCQPCDHDGPRLPAHGYCVECKEHLCETCFTLHKRHTLSRHHTLLDKSRMPQTMSSASVHPSQPDSLTKPCPKHMKEMIKFYCQNHEALLCSVCVTLEHTSTSCKVNYIPDISGQVINSKEHRDILKAMDTIIEQCCNKSKDMKKIIAKSNSSLTNVLADIKKFRKELNQRLDELERQAEDAAKAIQQENNENLKTVETTCNDVTKSLKTSSDTIKHLNTPKHADKLFMELKFAEQMIKDYEKRVHQSAAYDVKEYNFMPNKSISTLLDKERSLGTFIEKSLKQPSPPPAVEVKSRQISHQGKICVKTSKDKHTCFITGMTLLTPYLIITDQINNAVKMVDTLSQSVTDQLQLDTQPSKVTSVTSTELAVTLPEKQNIQFISVSSNKLKKKQTLKVDGQCYGISCCNGKLVVSFKMPEKLQILDINGTILTTVTGGDIFSSPLYVTTNTNFVYVSGWNMKTITRLNWQGEVISSYGGLTGPVYITLSDDGTIFVCDKKRNAIIEEMAGDCSTGKVVLMNLNAPYAVCWCAETSKLYFSCNTWEDKHDNFLQVVKLS
ncbi:uncharacterized protein LOC123565791 [Mercenaria mercenaria]|uniref:uncharacterized protein LOC123565791 n=1 Tax=Mercenaria mercenaria TaxID=6596 RepID=UPI00234EED4A|nr:uncharacterized protein LOC123565791 [Mercenaria mercenaria]